MLHSFFVVCLSVHWTFYTSEGSHGRDLNKTAKDITKTGGTCADDLNGVGKMFNKIIILSQTGKAKKLKYIS